MKSTRSPLRSTGAIIAAKGRFWWSFVGLSRLILNPACIHEECLWTSSLSASLSMIPYWIAWSHTSTRTLGLGRACDTDYLIRQQPRPVTIDSSWGTNRLNVFLYARMRFVSFCQQTTSEQMLRSEWTQWTNIMSSIFPYRFYARRMKLLLRLRPGRLFWLLLAILNVKCLPFVWHVSTPQISPLIAFQSHFCSFRVFYTKLNDFCIVSILRTCYSGRPT
jgi:hypothetical protein